MASESSGNSNTVREKLLHAALEFFLNDDHQSDQQCRNILQNLKTAFNNKRPCIIIGDLIAAETGIDQTTAAMDMQMLVNTQDREREPLLNGNSCSTMKVLSLNKYLTADQ